MSGSVNRTNPCVFHRRLAWEIHFLPTSSRVLRIQFDTVNVGSWLTLLWCHLDRVSPSVELTHCWTHNGKCAREEPSNTASWEGGRWPTLKVEPWPLTPCTGPVVPPNSPFLARVWEITGLWRTWAGTFPLSTWPPTRWSIQTSSCPSPSRSSWQYRGEGRREHKYEGDQDQDQGHEMDKEKTGLREW